MCLVRLGTNSMMKDLNLNPITPVLTKRSMKETPVMPELLSSPI